MKKTITTATQSLSTAAQDHIHAEAMRYVQNVGEGITYDETLELIVLEHAELQGQIAEGVASSIHGVGSVRGLIDAMEGGELRLIDADEDADLLQFRDDVMAALNDPEAAHSVAALRSRICMLGVGRGWWKVEKAATVADEF